MDLSNLVNSPKDDEESGGGSSSLFNSGPPPVTAFGGGLFTQPPQGQNQFTDPPPAPSLFSNSIGHNTNGLDDRLKEEVSFSFEGADDDNNDDGDNDAEENLIDDAEEQITVHLDNAPIAEGGVENWNKANRTLFFRSNPVSIDGVTWVSTKGWSSSEHAFDQEKRIYPTATPGVPQSDDFKQLIIESYGVLNEYISTQDQLPHHSKDWEEVTQEYLQNYLNLLKQYTNSTMDDNVLDALSICMCFDTVLFTPSYKDITKPFMEWVNSVDPGWPVEDTREVIQTNPPTDHPSFWNYIHYLTIRGLSEAAASALKAASGPHLSSDVQECFDYAIQLFRSYPESDGTKYSFRQWRESCLDAKLKASEIAAVEWRLEVGKMFEIMSGDVDTVLNSAVSWYEAVGAMLKYRDPKRSRIFEYYQQAIASLPPDHTITWESGCAAVLGENYLQAIQKVESLDLSVAAILTQFCKYKGLLDRYVEFGNNHTKISQQPQQKQGIAEWLLMQHAQECLTIKELIGIGIEILRGIGTQQAIQIIGEVLPRLVGSSVDEIEWAVGIAAELGLEETERSINRATAQMFLANQAHLDAFVAFERAGDITGLSVHCWKLFEESLTTQEMPTDEITALAISENHDLELSPLIRECISPCAVLAGLIRNIQGVYPSNAAKYVVALLQFPYLPGKYIGILIAMTIPLLSREKPRIFKAADLISIMTAVDSWENGSKEELAAGMGLLEHSLAIAPSTTISAYDWRAQFQVGLSGEKIIQVARTRLAKEMSRAYLEGA